LNEVKEFSRQEVAKHSTENDCWIVYKNEVYDVTSFVLLHPAGPNYLLDYAGEDTSVEFDQVGHSEFASK
jgi:cytochrome b involved in lipid metabolism